MDIAVTRNNSLCLHTFIGASIFSRIFSPNLAKAQSSIISQHLFELDTDYMKLGLRAGAYRVMCRTPFKYFYLKDKIWEPNITRHTSYQQRLSHHDVAHEHRKKKKMYVSILIVKMFNCIMCVYVYITFSSID